MQKKHKIFDVCSGKNHNNLMFKIDIKNIRTQGANYDQSLS